MSRSGEAKADSGARLRAAREAIGIEQKDAAREFGVGPSTWSMYETGQRLPDVLVMARFCAKYGITLDWIYLEDASGIRSDLQRKVIARHHNPSAIALKI